MVALRDKGSYNLQYIGSIFEGEGTKCLVAALLPGKALDVRLFGKTLVELKSKASKIAKEGFW